MRMLAATATVHGLDRKNPNSLRTGPVGFSVERLPEVSGVGISSDMLFRPFPIA